MAIQTSSFLYQNNIPKPANASTKKAAVAYGQRLDSGQPDLQTANKPAQKKQLLGLLAVLTVGVGALVYFSKSRKLPLPHFQSRVNQPVDQNGVSQLCQFSVTKTTLDLMGKHRSPKQLSDEINELRNNELPGDVYKRFREIETALLSPEEARENERRFLGLVRAGQVHLWHPVQQGGLSPYTFMYMLAKHNIGARTVSELSTAPRINLVRSALDEGKPVAIVGHWREYPPSIGVYHTVLLLKNNGRYLMSDPNNKNWVEMPADFFSGVSSETGAIIIDRVPSKRFRWS